MARQRQMDRSPAAESQEQPYAQYTVRFFDNRIEASIEKGLEKLSVGKMQRSLRFLFREFGQRRRRLYGHVTKENEAALASARAEAREKEQQLIT